MYRNDTARLYIFLIVLLSYNSAFAQTPDITWQRSLGGVKDDYSYAMDLTLDSEIIVAGTSYSNEGDVTDHHGTQYRSDMWITKIDTYGNLDWQRSLGGPDDDGAYTVLQTSDGGFLTAGFSKSNSGDLTGHYGEIGTMDCWIVKLNSAGIMEWQKNFGGTGYDYIKSVIENSEGDYVFIADVSSNDFDVSGNHGKYDVWVVKISSDGEIIWQSALGGSENEYSAGISQTSDGGYILSAETYSNNGDIIFHYGSDASSDTWIVKLNALGEIEWQKVYGGTFSEFSEQIIPAAEGGYIFISNSRSDDHDLDLHHGDPFYPDLWIVKISITGLIEWQKVIGGDSYDKGFSIEQTSDLGYLICGETSSNEVDVFGNHGGSDVWMLKVNNSGELLWQKCFGGTGSDYGGNLKMINDSIFVFGGYTTSTDGDLTENAGAWDFWAGKTGPCVSEFYYADSDEDGFGNIGASIFACEKPFGFVADSSDCNDENASINPEAAEVFNGEDDNCDGNTDEGVYIETSKELLVNIYPNPADDIINIILKNISDCTITILNANGQSLIKLNNSMTTNRVDISGLIPGLYLIRIQDTNQIIIHKLIVE